MLTPSGEGNMAPAHLQCPFCSSYAVDRLFVASLRLDSCRCVCCRAQWEEDYASRPPDTKASARSKVKGRKESR
jgi:hypothetical protein